MSFCQYLSSVVESLNPLLLPSNRMLATLPHHQECTNLHQSACLDQNRSHGRYLHHHQKILHLFRASQAWLRIRHGSILARKTAGHLVLTKHCRVSYCHSLDQLLPRKLNTPLLLFFDLGAWFGNEIFPFLFHCGAWKDFYGHFGHIQCPAHVGLFQLYPTTLPCHSCRHVVNSQEISCCF